MCQIQYLIMFAKVFGQIFDSSIAEDYNCRRMFMDLLVLADPTGAVDMTHEAISRRTNVPIEEVRKYIDQLCQPDPASRSKLEDGKRLVQLDKHRDWAWQIVNYGHYRKLKDQEALRSYFRDAQRKARAKKKKELRTEEEEVEEGVKVRSTPLNDVKPMSLTTSVFSSKRRPKDLAAVIAYAKTRAISKEDAEAFFDSMEAGGWTRNGKALKDWEAHLRAYKSNGYLASQRKTGKQWEQKKPDPIQSRIDREFEEAQKRKAERREKQSTTN